MDNTTIRILLIEDDFRIIFPGLKSLFRPSRDMIDFVSAVPTPEHALSTPESSFDLIFLDLFIENKDPVDSIKRLKLKFQNKPIIIYSTEESFLWINKTISAGASGYLTKKDSKEKMKAVIKSVASGQIVFSGNGDLNDKFKLTMWGETMLISEFQKKIVSEISKGKTIKGIAKEHNVSSSSIDKNLAALRKKFQVKNNYQLLTFLSKSGIL